MLSAVHQRTVVEDHVKEVLGAQSLVSTADRKFREKQQKLAYGEQLRQQAQAQAQAKTFERMERMGLTKIPSAGNLQQMPPQMPPQQQQDYQIHTVMPNAAQSMGPGMNAPQPHHYASNGMPQQQPGFMQPPPMPMVQSSQQDMFGAPMNQQQNQGSFNAMQPSFGMQGQGLSQAMIDPRALSSSVDAGSPPGYAPKMVSFQSPMQQPGQMMSGPSFMNQPPVQPPIHQQQSFLTSPNSFMNNQPQPQQPGMIQYTGIQAPWGENPSRPPVKSGNSYGYGGTLMTQGMSPAEKAAEQAKKGAYRAELEAQMRENEARKRAEKQAAMAEAQARQASLVANDYAAAMNRMGGGGGAPLRDQAGNVLSDLSAMRGYQHARDREQGMMPPGFGGGGGPGPFSGPSFMGGPPMHNMGPHSFGGGPPPDLGPPMGGPGGYGPSSPRAGGGMGMPPDMPPPHMGGMMQQQQQPQGPPGMNPVLKFRSDNAYATAAELETKARQKAELQDALERQIAEKRYKKELEKAQQHEEAMREEARLRGEQERLRDQYSRERKKESGKDDTDTADPVAAAWAKAKAETEEAKNKKFNDRRAAGRSSIEAGQGFSNLLVDNATMIGAGGDGGGPNASGNTFDGGSSSFSQRQQQPVMQSVGSFQQQRVVMQAPSTPLMAEKVKQLAEQELQKVKEELHAEAEKLRNVVHEQSAQMAALQRQAEMMESRAEQAHAQVSSLRVDLLRSSMAAPESFTRILSDYPLPHQQQPGPSMLDIVLDLPPPAAVQRRAQQGQQPLYDMGPLIPPVHNPQEADKNLQQSFLGTGPPSRPPTQGLRTINPLEASMAAESIFIYPNGREMPRSQLPAHASAISAATHAASALPFKSLALASGELSELAASSKLLNPGMTTLATNNPSQNPSHFLVDHRSLTHPAMVSVDTAMMSPKSPKELQQSSVMMSPSRVAAALSGVALGSPTAGSPMSGATSPAGGSRIRSASESSPKGSYGVPPGTADAVQKLQDQLRQEAADAAQAAHIAATPADVETLMQQNKDKLALLQQLTAISSTNSVEAIDAFLTQYSKTRPGLPERTRTPVFRINTPTPPTANTATTSVGYYHSPYPQPQHPTTNHTTQTISARPSMNNINTHERFSPHRKPTSAGSTRRLSGTNDDADTATSNTLKSRTSVGGGGGDGHGGNGMPPRSPIKFTDNMRSAAPSISGTDAGGVSRPHSTSSNNNNRDVTGHGLDADGMNALGYTADVQAALKRTPSFGRRSDSAGNSGNNNRVAAGSRAPVPIAPVSSPAKQYNSLAQLPPDSIDVEMRHSGRAQAGDASRPVSGQSQTGALPSRFSGQLPPFGSRPVSGSSVNGVSNGGGNRVHPKDGSLSGMALPEPGSVRSLSKNDSNIHKMSVL